MPPRTGVAYLHALLHSIALAIDVTAPRYRIVCLKPYIRYACAIAHIRVSTHAARHIRRLYEYVCCTTASVTRRAETEERHEREERNFVWQTIFFNSKIRSICVERIEYLIVYKHKFERFYYFHVSASTRCEPRHAASCTLRGALAAHLCAPWPCSCGLGCGSPFADERRRRLGQGRAAWLRSWPQDVCL